MSEASEGGANLKRLLSILTIAVVVLAVTAGPAFASVCAGTMCGEVMLCSPTTTSACPMESGPMMHSLCTHGADHGSHDVVVTSPAPQHGLPSTPLEGTAQGTATLLRSGLCPLADARGAPHLTTVIRI